MKHRHPKIEPLANPHTSFGPVPRRLHRYELIEELARGGMARVFLCRQTGQAGFRRLYAIKLLHGHLVDEPGYAARFLDEARWAARIHHPNVVSILDVGHVGRVYYATMDYVEGCTLKELLLRSPNERPARLIAPIMIDMLSGLHAAHTLLGSNGEPLHLVHRDVSPANTLVGIDGISRISDFGISKARDQTSKTTPGIFLGKLAYGAPEQFVTDGSADERSDIFAAGAVLWTALTGQPLFLGKSPAATLSNVMRMTVPPPSTRGIRPPPVFDAICLKALSRDPRKRFQTARAMAGAIREAAMAHGMLGSEEEIGEWVWNTAGSMLEERRSRIVEFDAQRVNTDPGSYSDSGLRERRTSGAFASSSRGGIPDWQDVLAENSTRIETVPLLTRKPRYSSEALGDPQHCYEQQFARSQNAFRDPPASLGDTLDELVEPPSASFHATKRPRTGALRSWLVGSLLAGLFSAGVWLGWTSPLVPQVFRVLRASEELALPDTIRVMKTTAQLTPASQNAPVPAVATEPTTSTEDDSTPPQGFATPNRPAIEPTSADVQDNPKDGEPTHETVTVDPTQVSVKALVHVPESQPQTTPLRTRTHARRRAPRRALKARQNSVGSAKNPR